MNEGWYLKKNESLFQKPIHDLFTVCVEDLLQILAYKLFESFLNIISIMIIEQEI